MSFSDFGSLSPVLTSIATLGLLYGTYKTIQRTSRHSLPPGPPAWPLVGNIIGFSPYDAYKVLDEYKQKYGDVVMIHGLGTHILVLSSMEVISDLLVKRGDVFSNRPVLTFASELMTLEKSTPMIQYGADWRVHRKLMNSGFGPSAIKEFQRVQEKLTIQLCAEILNDPLAFFNHIGLFGGRVVLATVYGIEVASKDDELVQQTETTMRFVSDVTVPGAFLCDIFPSLKHLPRWVPFHRKAEYGKAMVEATITMPFDRVREEMAAGTAPPSLTRNLLSEDGNLSDEYLSYAKWTAGSLYAPGSETTAATVIVFMMGMLLNPEAYKKAKAEVDKVVGSERMPTIADKSDLPYLDAAIRETMRWRPILPLGLARRTEGDCVYGDYLIPHNTIVIPNAWTIAHEPNSKYDPALFIPERFLDPTQNIVDPLSYTFGFGRRLCPGKALAQDSLFIAISSLLWTFDFSLEPGAKLVPQFQPGLIGYPKPFDCKIVPRTQERAQILRKYELSYQ